MKLGNIHNYKHPFVTVDGVILRYCFGHLEVLLVKREEDPEEGLWSLPGGFVDIDKRMDDVLRTKVKAKTGVSGFYQEQLKTYDSFKRDPRGRVISVAYLGLTNDIKDVGCWFQIHGNTLVRHTEMGETLPAHFYDGQAEKVRLSDLAFDHGHIIHDALDRLAGKLWYSDLPKYLLPQEFLIRDAARMYAILEHHETKNFIRKIGKRVQKTNRFETPTEKGGRPAELFYWKGVSEDDDVL